MFPVEILQYAYCPYNNDIFYYHECAELTGFETFTVTEMF